MSNIKNNNFNKLDLRLSNNDYWDFYLANDETPVNTYSAVTSGNCSVVWYDFNNLSIYPNNDPTKNSIKSLYSWNDAINSGYTFNTIGLTGIDNGLITFEKTTGDTTNQALLSALTGTTLVINSGDTKLTLTKVTGTTGNYIYPMTRVVGGNFTSGGTIQLCGGFYQGYYKIDGTSYEVLPTRVTNSWSGEFWLNPTISCTGYTGTTLNDTYPNNKGFFFYMGTRAENKFWNQFAGENTGCTSDCVVNTGDTSCSAFTGSVSTWCTIPKETEISVIGEYGIAIPLSPPQVKIDLIKNQFLIYGRAFDASPAKLTGNSGTLIFSSGDTSTNSINYGCSSNSVYSSSFGVSRCNLASEDGLGTKTVSTYDGNGIAVSKTSEVLTNFQNPFLIYGRSTAGSYSGCSCSACSGTGDGLGNETVCSFSGRTSPQTEIDYNLDIIDNAIGFRIKDDGSIGYRMLTVTGTCYTATTGEKLYTSGISITEGYSVSGIVSANSWSYVVVKYTTDYKNECDLVNYKRRKGKLMFYVNSKLKYIVDEFPEFIAKRLEEHKTKQVGVPFNFSLGGGSQGLIESQTFDGLDMADRNLPIEQNFAGTFIGKISQFKFNICDLPLSVMREYYKNTKNQYS